MGPHVVLEPYYQQKISSHSNPPHLSEITEVARNLAIAIEADDPRGIAFSQDRPFISIVSSKATKKYQNGNPGLTTINVLTSILVFGFFANILLTSNRSYRFVWLIPSQCHFHINSRQILQFGCRLRQCWMPQAFFSCL